MHFLVYKIDYLSADWFEAELKIAVLKRKLPDKRNTIFLGNHPIGLIMQL